MPLNCMRSVVTRNKAFWVALFNRCLRFQIWDTFCVVPSLENHLVRAYVCIFVTKRCARRAPGEKNTIFMTEYHVLNHSLPCLTTPSDPQCRKNAKWFSCIKKIKNTSFFLVSKTTYKKIFGGSTYKNCKCYLQEKKLCLVVLQRLLSFPLRALTWFYLNITFPRGCARVIYKL